MCIGISVQNSTEILFYSNQSHSQINNFSMKTPPTTSCDFVDCSPQRNSEIIGHVTEEKFTCNEWMKNSKWLWNFFRFLYILHVWPSLIQQSDMVLSVRNNWIQMFWGIMNPIFIWMYWFGWMKVSKKIDGVGQFGWVD